MKKSYIALKAKAKKATPGPWPKAENRCDGKCSIIQVEGDGWNRLELEINRDDCNVKQADADAAYIAAAHPTLILQLVEELETAEKTIYKLAKYSSKCVD
jgi:hypothetical protein